MPKHVHNYSVEMHRHESDIGGGREIGCHYAQLAMANGSLQRKSEVPGI